MTPPNMRNKAKNSKKTLLQLLSFLKYYWLPITIGLLCAGGSTVLAIIGPNQIYKIGMLVVEAPVNMSDVAKLGIGLLIIYISSFLLSFLQGFLMSGVTAKISKDFRNKISRKINKK